MTEKSVSPFIIGIAGGTASGKSALVAKIIEAVESSSKRKIATISMDSFYRELTDEELLEAKESKFNFDHPSAFDFKEMYEALLKIKRNEGSCIYNYNMREFKRSTSDFIDIQSDTSVLLIVGILALYSSDIRNIMDLKVFVDCDSDTRLSRRVIRDTQENKRDINDVLSNYINFVKPAFEDFCLPTKKYADIILPHGPNNKIGNNVIIQHIEDVLDDKSHRKFITEISPTKKISPNFKLGDKYDDEYLEIGRIINRRSRNISESANCYNDMLGSTRPH